MMNKFNADEWSLIILAVFAMGGLIITALGFGVAIIRGAELMSKE